MSRREPHAEALMLSQILVYAAAPDHSKRHIVSLFRLFNFIYSILQKNLKTQKGRESMYNVAFEVSQLFFCFSIIFDLPFVLNNWSPITNNCWLTDKQYWIAPSGTGGLDNKQTCSVSEYPCTTSSGNLPTSPLTGSHIYLGWSLGSDIQGLSGIRNLI